MKPMEMFITRKQSSFAHISISLSIPFWPDWIRIDNNDDDDDNNKDNKDDDGGGSSSSSILTFYFANLLICKCSHLHSWHCFSTIINTTEKCTSHHVFNHLDFLWLLCIQIMELIPKFQNEKNRKMKWNSLSLCTLCIFFPLQVDIFSS